MTLMGCVFASRGGNVSALGNVRIRTCSGLTISSEGGDSDKRGWGSCSPWLSSTSCSLIFFVAITCSLSLPLLFADLVSELREHLVVDVRCDIVHHPLRCFLTFGLV